MADASFPGRNGWCARGVWMAAVVVATALPSHSPAQQAGPGPSSRELYQASIAAAEANLRLHEVERARHWLERAPRPERGWEWGYLDGLSDRSTARFPVGEATITDLALDPSGGTLAVTASSGAVVLLDAASGAVLRTLRGHTASAWSPTFSSDGRRLATASSDGTVRVWDVATGAPAFVGTGVGEGVAATAWSPDDARVAVTSWKREPGTGVQGTLSVWDAATGERTVTREHGGYPIGSLAWSADGARLMGGTWDFDVVVWDTRSWADPITLSPPESRDYKRILDLELDPRGRYLAVAHADARVRVWDLEAGEIVRVIHAPTEGTVKTMSDVVWLGDGDRLATVSGDLTVRLWSREGEPLGSFHGHTRPPASLAASPDGGRLYSGGGEGEVFVWDLEALDPARTAWATPHTAYSVDLDPSGERAVVATWEGWLAVIDTRSGRELRRWAAHERAAVSADWSPDGRWIASTGSDGRVVLWDAATGVETAVLQEAGRQLESLAFSPDGARLAAPGPGAQLSLWAVASGKGAGGGGGGGAEEAGVSRVETGGVSDTAAAVAAVRWSPDGSVLVTTHPDGTVRLRDREGRVREVIDAAEGATPRVAFDPSGTRLLVASGRTVRIRDVDRREWAATWAPRTATVQAVAWSPDGRRIAAALGGNRFEIWDAETGDALLPIPHTASAWDVVWTGQGDLLLVPLDGTVRRLVGGSGG